MKMLNLNIGTMVMRLHLMCAVMVTLGFLGYMFAGIVIGMIIFLATLMGIQFKHINPFRYSNTSKQYEWKHRHEHHHAH